MKLIKKGNIVIPLIGTCHSCKAEFEEYEKKLDFVYGTCKKACPECTDGEVRFYLPNSPYT